MNIFDEVTHKNDGDAQKKQAKKAVDPQKLRTKRHNVQFVLQIKHLKHISNEEVLRQYQIYNEEADSIPLKNLFSIHILRNQMTPSPLNMCIGKNINVHFQTSADITKTQLKTNTWLNEIPQWAHREVV